MSDQPMTPKRKPPTTLPPAPKKAKLQPAYPIAGIACAILNDNGEIFLFENDRHHWPEGVKEEWQAQFIGDAPFQVYTVTETLDFGTSYDDIEQARAIVQHMVSKMVPKYASRKNQEAFGQCVKIHSKCCKCFKSSQKKWKSPLLGNGIRRS